MYIVAIGWIYVVLMMSITETSVTAGAMTFLLYGILPLAVILYLMNTPQRRARRKEIEKRQIAESGSQNIPPPEDLDPS
jgi:biotin transporter BioY